MSEPNLFVFSQSEFSFKKLGMGKALEVHSRVSKVFFLPTPPPHPHSSLCFPLTYHPKPLSNFYLFPPQTFHQEVHVLNTASQYPLAVIYFALRFQNAGMILKLLQFNTL